MTYKSWHSPYISLSNFFQVLALVHTPPFFEYLFHSLLFANYMSFCCLGIIVTLHLTIFLMFYFLFFQISPTQIFRNKMRISQKHKEQSSLKCMQPCFVTNMPNSKSNSIVLNFGAKFSFVPCWSPLRDFWPHFCILTFVLLKLRVLIPCITNFVNIFNVLMKFITLIESLKFWY